MAATAEETRRWAWTPRVPLTAAERRVDFPLHNRHIIERRLAVERHATPAARRLAFLVAEHGLPTGQVKQDLEERLYVSLTRSVEFGYQQVRRELRDPLRTPIRAAVILPDIGKRGRTVLQGLAGIHGLVRSRAAVVAGDVADAAASASHGAALKPGSTAVAVRLAVNDAVRRTLHNDVLQLVGEAINLGRAAAAVEVLAERGGPRVLAAAAQTVPEFAMRSEQLDERTCDECDAAHGAIVQVGSAEFYDEMPPAGCAGGGRCRGVYVFGEGSEFAAPSSVDEAARSESLGTKISGTDSQAVMRLINDTLAADIKSAGPLTKMAQDIRLIQRPGTPSMQTGILGHIEIYAPDVQDIAALEEAFQKALRSGFIVPNGDFRYALFHELGHTRQAQFRAFGDLADALADGTIKQSDLGHYVASINGKRDEEVLWQEAWAEIYAAVRSGRLDELPASVQAFVRRHPDAF